MESIWQKTVSMPEFPAIEGTCTTDVAIIGGGMTGILTAFFLRRNGVDCMVLEKERICSGTTAGTTAKLSVQHGLIYHELIKTKGAELAGAYLSANRRALGMWEKLTKEIDCDYQQTDSYIYSMERRRVLEEELEALRRIGGTAEFCENPGLPMKVAGAVKIPRQAQFHPFECLGISCFWAVEVTGPEKTVGTGRSFERLRRNIIRELRRSVHGQHKTASALTADRTSDFIPNTHLSCMSHPALINGE